MKNLIFVITFILTAFSITTHVNAATSIVNCLIEEQGQTVLSKKCSFTALEGGSFILSSGKRNIPLYQSQYGGVRSVDVNVNKNGEHAIFISYMDGTGDYDYNVYRSKLNKGCWDGDGLRVCAWK